MRDLGRRRMLMSPKKGGEYKLLTSIVGNGAAACKLPWGTVSDSNLVIECEFSISQKENQYLWGAYIVNQGAISFGYTGKDYFLMACSGSTQKTVNIKYTSGSGFKSFSVLNSTLTACDGTTLTIDAFSISSDYIGVFGYTDSNDELTRIATSSASLRHLKLGNGTYLYDLYPVEDSETGEIGWLDIENNDFYPSDTGTPFTSGGYDASGTTFPKN